MNQDRIRELEAAATRCEREYPGFTSDLDWRIHRALGRSRGSFYWGNTNYTTCLKTAAAEARARGWEWDLTTLYGVARVSIPLNTDTGPCYGSNEFGHEAMAFYAAFLRAQAAELVTAADRHLEDIRRNGT